MKLLIWTEHNFHSEALKLNHERPFRYLKNLKNLRINIPKTNHLNNGTFINISDPLFLRLISRGFLYICRHLSWRATDVPSDW